MTAKTTFYIQLQDAPLQQELCARVADDWSLDFAYAYNGSCSKAGIAVVDNPALLEKLTPCGTLTIYVGQPPANAPNPFAISAASVEAIHQEIRRANRYCEVVSLNQGANVSSPDSNQPWSDIVQALSTRLRQLTRQAEMRISLVEQLPVAVIGIDAEGVVVLANARARDFLMRQPAPLYGMTIDTVFPKPVCTFLRQRDKTRVQLTWHDTQVVLAKDDFVLEHDFAGMVLTICELDYNDADHA